MEQYINKIVKGDCLENLKKLPKDSIHAIVTDPPYGWSFMGKKWDYDVPSVDVWQECLRVLKPGGHILVACGTRTQHRMAVNIEDAGFEIRDVVAWVYGSGFPKSMNIGKAVDKMSNNKREVVEIRDVGHDIRNGGFKDAKHTRMIMEITKGKSPWEGWGTALKPSMELWTLARKPISEKNIAANVLKWETGGININGCRVLLNSDNKTTPDNGRFPANLIHDGSDEVVSLFPQSKGQQGNVKGTEKSHTGDENSNCYSKYGRIPQLKRGDSGSAARFFYCAKASKKERGGENHHPTVKPIKLMEYLCKLITPPVGIVLDPFIGSGSTAVAAKACGFRFIGFEKNQEYAEIAEKRLSQQI